MRFRDGQSPGEHDDRGYRGPERRSDPPPVEVAPVRLTRKYAEAIDGIDLSSRDVGDRLPLPPREANLLIAEGWAEPVPARDRRECRDEARGQSADEFNPPRDRRSR